jgi:hypothetical protein
MNELIEWLKGLDYTALYTMLGTFVTAWGGSIVALVVGLLKQRTKNFNYQQALEKLQLKLSQEQTDKIEALRNDIVNMLNHKSLSHHIRDDSRTYLFANVKNVRSS